MTTFIRITLYRLRVGFTLRNALKDAWRCVRGIY